MIDSRSKDSTVRYPITDFIRPPEVVVYRLWDARGSLLYVGMTEQLIMRLNTHRLRAKFWAEVASISLQPCTTRAEALQVESQCITDNAPPHNHINRPDLDGAIWARMPRKSVAS